MTTAAPTWPTFSAPLLREVAAAFRRRHRAIRYHGQLSCSQEFSETAVGSYERLNIDHEDRLRLQLRLSLWEDGACWLRACIRRPGWNSGWAFLDHFYVNLDGLTPAEVVEKFEVTIRLLAGDAAADRRESLRGLWRVGPSPG
jgi:hypothetical protein